MCCNIKAPFDFELPASELEIRDASLQFVRKLSGGGSCKCQDIDAGIGYQRRTQQPRSNQGASSTNDQIWQVASTM